MEVLPAILFATILARRPEKSPALSHQNPETR
jgi:hypothetical protein